MSPIVDTLSLSNTGSHVVPVFVVFQTPPEALPTYTMFGLLSTTPKSSIRPPITAGPISRNSKFFSLSVGFDWPTVQTGARIASPTQNTTAATIVLKANKARRIFFPPVCKAGHHTSSTPRRASIVSGMANQSVFRQTRNDDSAFRSAPFSAKIPLPVWLRVVHLGSATHRRSRMLGYATVFIAQMFCVNVHPQARTMSALRLSLFLAMPLYFLFGPALPL